MGSHSVFPTFLPLTFRMCEAWKMCVLLCDFIRSCTCERTLCITRYISLPLNQQNFSVTGLVVIIIITEAITSSHSSQDICKAIRFAHLLTIYLQLYQYHLILQYSERSTDTIFNWEIYIYYVCRGKPLYTLMQSWPRICHGLTQLNQIALISTLLYFTTYSIVWLKSNIPCMRQREDMSV